MITSTYHETRDLAPANLKVLAPIAGGGMGRVWLVRSRGGRELALKLIRPEWASEPLYRAAFGREIRAAAALVHPHIVRVLNFGVIDRASAHSLGIEDALRVPFILMELARGGSLADLRLPLDGLRVLDILAQLLGALSAAHAHGVLHRDLKPSNILMDTRPGGEMRYMLADFGVAWSLNPKEPSDGDRVAGTRDYMAPEQRIGDWRRFGPWTDLFALGLLAYRLSTGRAPTDAIGHDIRPCDLTPKLRHPSYALWLSRMLEPSIPHRFASAAEALRALGAVQLTEAAPTDAGCSPASVLAHASTVVMQEDRPLSLVAPPCVGGAGEQAAPSGAGSSHPRPWRAIGSLGEAPAWRDLPSICHAPDASPVGAAQVLLLRDSAFVGREAERDALWDAVGQCLALGQGRAIAITGDPGSGRSRLARWLARRVTQAGLMHTVWLGSAPAGRPEPDTARGWELLEKGCDIGPTLVVIDDLDTSQELRALAAALTRSNAPVTLVATRCRAGRAVAESPAIGWNRVLNLRPLARCHIRQMIASTIQLGDPATDLIVRASDGNPGVVRALVDEVLLAISFPSTGAHVNPVEVARSAASRSSDPGCLPGASV